MTNQKSPTILFEDDDMMVLDKPSGMTVNRSDTTANEQTVQDFTTSYLHLVDEQKKVEDEEFYSRGGIVHRLDKETSGILLVAKHTKAFLGLKEQFMARTVKKEYVALAHGFVKPDNGEISVPVGRLPWSRKQFGIVPGGREAVTSYTSNGNFTLSFNHHRREVTLLTLRPHTGRTHQIRVHLKYIGYPIFADFLYAGRKIAREDRKLLSRVFLHAESIEIFHPTTKKLLTFKSDLPEELSTVIKMCIPLEENIIPG